MRIEIIFENPYRETVIPLNYNYFLTTCIYRMLETSSPVYSAKMHKEGYRFGGKRFKLFTFSQLLPKRWQVLNSHFLLIQSRESRWLISSPVGEFVMHLVDGILAQGKVQVGKVAFQVLQARTLVSPDFTSSMRFTCLSPITMSTKIERNGKITQHYCRLEENFYEKVLENLRRKYELLTGNSADGLQLNMEFDSSYISRRGGRITKLIDFKGIKILGYLAPLMVEGDAELIRIGYECGFGDKNSAGFGMVEVV
ncbi:MAG: CRISPR-associated endoribonuclease Cas6 [Candidatus Poribacteria bacterium]